MDWICAPGNVNAPALGLTEDEGLSERDAEAEAEEDGESDTEDDGDTDEDGLGERLSLALGLLMISRMARCTAARSSDVAFEKPIEREPCPAVVSRTT